MLNLKIVPDEIITAIITNSFDFSLDNLSAEDGEEWFKCNYPNVTEVFSFDMAIKTLQNLRFCHQSPGVYGFNDFHLVLIYDVLNLYCVHKNLLSGKSTPIIKGTKIVEIDFEGLLKLFLSNTDFCVCCLVKKEGKPTLEKLENKLLEEDEYLLWDDKNDVPLFNLESTKYPQHLVEERNNHA
jgi:hypothetical protein